MQRSGFTFAATALTALVACGGAQQQKQNHDPQSLVVVSGSAQTAVAGARLAQPLVVRVVDSAGTPVADQAIAFNVTAGGGKLSAANVSTNADGIAQDVWTLGPVAGAGQAVEARIDLPSGVQINSTFSATAVAGAPATIIAVQGDGQKAAPSAQVAIAPSLTVRDAHGNAVPGVEVPFTVTSGGGSVAIGLAHTDSQGVATGGAWTLGSATGPNTVTATVAGLTPVVFTATAGRQSGSIAVTIVSPSKNAIVDENMSILAKVTSTFQLASVQASVGAASTALTNGLTGWQGVVSLPGQAQGPVVVVVTATDIFGNVTDAVGQAILDRKPVVTVAAPLADSIAGPSIDISAACADDEPAGCESLTVTVNGTVVVARGTAALEQPLDLSAYEGQRVLLQFKGFDAAFQRAEVDRFVFVESSPHVAVRASVSGDVLDVLGTRVVYLDSSGATPALRIQDLSSGGVQDVATGAISSAFLYPSGVVYVRDNAGNPATAHDWKGSVTADLGAITTDSLVVAGTWAIFNQNEIGNTLVERDLSSGVNVVIGPAGSALNDVAANGDVAYSTSNNNVFRYRAGASVALTTDNASMFPRTDGQEVVYRKNTCTNGNCTLAINDGSAEVVLDGQGNDYAVAGGWIAFNRLDSSNTLQVWKRNGTTEQQVTFFGSSSDIDAIAPDGALMVRTGINSLNTAPRRNWAVPGAAIVDVGSTNGKTLYRDGKFVVLLGNSVLDLVP